MISISSMCITKQKQVQVQGQKSNSTFNIRYSSFNIQNTRNTPKVPSRGQFFLRNFTLTLLNQTSKTLCVALSTQFTSKETRCNSVKNLVLLCVTKKSANKINYSKYFSPITFRIETKPILSKSISERFTQINS